MAAGGVDPLRVHHFALEVTGVDECIFRECSGLEMEIQVVEDYQMDAKGKMVLKKLPGPIKYSNIILRRGVTDSMKLTEWFQKAKDGKMGEARKNGSVVAYAPDATEVARWNFTNGWICKLKGPTMHAGQNEMSVEECEITHEELIRAT
ncbi:MAG: phage tail protein [bacterium]|jgi:phage tail-like protein